MSNTISRQRLSAGSHFSVIGMLCVGVLLALVGALLVKRSFASSLTNPTHYVDTYWYWPTGDYTNFNTLITPLNDPSPDGYYFSSGFWFAQHLSDDGGYMGIQTEGAQPTGKIAIFSIWNSVAGQGSGTILKFNEYGTGYSARITYNWIPGRTYQLHVAKTTASSNGDWWSAAVKDMTTGQDTLIGRLEMPPGYGDLDNQSYTFHERYSGPLTSCSALRYSAVTFTGITANFGAVTPTSHFNEYPTATGCNNFYTTELSNGIKSVVGANRPGDINGDGVVGIQDLSVLATHWGQPATAATGDLNGDGMVTITDLSILASNWTP